MDPKNEDGSKSGTLFFWGPFFNIVICMKNISRVFERAANFASSFPHIPRGRLVSVTPTGTEVGLALSCSIVHVRASKMRQVSAFFAFFHKYNPSQTSQRNGVIAPPLYQQWFHRPQQGTRKLKRTVPKKPNGPHYT
jgi:hypothetical protein